MARLPEDNVDKSLLSIVLEAQLESSSHAIAVEDTAGNLVMWNKRFTQMLNISDEVAQGSNFATILGKETVEQSISSPNTDSTKTIELNCKKIEVKSKLLIDETHYHGRIWILSDTPLEPSGSGYEDYTNQLQRMVANRTQELIEAERLAASGTLASEIAHDLRSPLQSIRNAVFMIRQDAARTDVGLEIIEKSVLRSLEMLDGMRSSTRKAEPQLEKTDLNQIISDVVNELPHPENISIQFELDENSQAWIDGSQIRRVLDNILLNAVEAMPEGGSISITKQTRGDRFIIQISDTGVGIPEEVLPNLFELKFYTTKPHGLGLGLSYCYRTVKSHGGNIMVDSVLGKGTVFTIELPNIS